jgi:regulator of PEP synthase PpsR (kinase-PPPase family)
LHQSGPSGDRPALPTATDHDPAQESVMSTSTAAVKTPPSKVIYLVSDGTCRTCEIVVRAVLVQFRHEEVRVVKKAQVRRPRTVRNVVTAAAGEGAVVFYTLVYDKARMEMEAAARELMVPTVDILGPALVALYDLFKTTQRAKPGMLYRSNKEHFDRIDAVEYTLHHDDGCRINELADADVVLVGVSRACKSTTCSYLAYSGVRAANVPLLPDGEPPVELRRLDPRRVIGLTSNPYRLQSVRESRLQTWGGDVAFDYAEKRQIATELRWANEVMTRYGWRCIDTSYKAIEEIAREVIQLLTDSGIRLRRPGE